MSDRKKQDDNTKSDTGSVNNDPDFQEPADSVWKLILNLTGMNSCPSGFKEMVGGFSDWEHFIVVPEGYYSGHFSEFPTDKLERSCREFALMSDNVVCYWQQVDCTCTLQTVPQSSVVFLEVIFGLR